MPDLVQLSLLKYRYSSNDNSQLYRPDIIQLRSLRFRNISNANSLQYCMYKCTGLILYCSGTRELIVLYKSECMQLRGRILRQNMCCWELIYRNDACTVRNFCCYMANSHLIRPLHNLVQGFGISDTKEHAVIWVEPTTFGHAHRKQWFSQMSSHVLTERALMLLSCKKRNTLNRPNLFPLPGLFRQYHL